jgi:hypothetical protein
LEEDGLAKHAEFPGGVARAAILEPPLQQEVGRCYFFFSISSNSYPSGPSIKAILLPEPVTVGPSLSG